MSTPSGRNKHRAGPSWEGDNSQLQFEDSSALLDEIPKMPDILPPLQLSSLSQSIFNTTNLLVGVGLLSLPYAMRLSGCLGLGILLFFAGALMLTLTLIPTRQRLTRAQPSPTIPGSCSERSWTMVEELGNEERKLRQRNTNLADDTDQLRQQVGRAEDAL
eukprot:CAMPEP_0202818646 /NCGR_PEP_ID=MMETSP1389-20130828/8501_1 /ASSEMBLY_ACC=CAM_ASM_000865 /TAXON_ID=302021 /ORGANISM="Rhodomonas sp., Strain CCMP768" /LENGTH=160 /DNA_ID=CAMNT_0049491045 /DNA_START=145 /DNA_END=623 /DNA_ORIENTATION=-